MEVFHDMVAANLGAPMAFFAAYLAFVLVGIKFRFRMFEPKDAPYTQKKPKEAPLSVGFEAEVA